MILIQVSSSLLVVKCLTKPLVEGVLVFGTIQSGSRY